MSSKDQSSHHRENARKRFARVEQLLSELIKEIEQETGSQSKIYKYRATQMTENLRLIVDNYQQQPWVRSDDDP